MKIFSNCYVFTQSSLNGREYCLCLCLGKQSKKWSEVSKNLDICYYRENLLIDRSHPKVMKLEDVRKAISEAGEHWEAEDNPIHRLSDEEKKYRCGFVPKQGTPSLEEREKQAKEANEAKVKTAEAKEAAVNQFDWRNYNGGNWITPIKDQGNCGSCIAFGTIATAEAVTRISKKNPQSNVDYSEADLFYCGAEKEYHRTCANGWNLNDAATYMSGPGVVDEACFPYTPGDQPCNLCADWQNRKTKLFSRIFTDTNMMREWISTQGPLTTCFSVYEDFFAYKNGVYVHTTGKLVAGHCVSVVGYDNTLNYGNPHWICKNSWGPDWGMKGFFKIAFGQCGIDHEMWSLELSGT